MTPLESWLAILLGAPALLWLVFRADAHLWKRKYERDDALDYLAAHERYRAALKRQHEKHVRIGHKETGDND